MKAAKSFSSDMYSFGIVVWEVLSLELPWAEASGIHDIYRRVVFEKRRPTIPVDAPADLSGMLKACWIEDPGERPTSKQLVRVLAENGRK